MLWPLDTSLDAYQRQLDAYRSMTPSERLSIADSMSGEVERLAAAGARSRDPDRRPEGPRAESRQSPDAGR